MCHPLFHWVFRIRQEKRGNATWGGSMVETDAKTADGCEQPDLQVFHLHWRAKRGWHLARHHVTHCFYWRFTNLVPSGAVIFGLLAVSLPKGRRYMEMAKAADACA
jgi:hypothetical protein